MRYIKRGSEPRFWVDYKRRHKGAFYHDLDSSEEGRQTRQDMRAHLVRSQYGLCCYCCSRVFESKDSSLIEHVKPQSLFPKESMDYCNIIASCAKGDTCGAAKGNVYEGQLVSPLQFDCATHFRFYPDGRVEGLTERGKKTVDLLKLNGYRLRDARYAMLRSLDWASEQYIREYLLAPDDDGNLEQFADMLEQFCDDNYFTEVAD